MGYTMFKSYPVLTCQDRTTQCLKERNLVVVRLIQQTVFFSFLLFIELIQGSLNSLTIFLLYQTPKVFTKHVIMMHILKFTRLKCENIAHVHVIVCINHSYHVYFMSRCYMFKHKSFLYCDV